MIEITSSGEQRTRENELTVVLISFQVDFSSFAVLTDLIVGWKAVTGLTDVVLTFTSEWKSPASRSSRLPV